MAYMYTLVACIGCCVVAINGYEDAVYAKNSAMLMRVENPFNVSVTEVHAIFSNHFDAGCKIPGCGRLSAGEPDRCARTGMKGGSMGEPWAYNVVNRYLDDFIQTAIDNAAIARDTRAGYKYMLQPWVAALYMDCNSTGAGVTSWPGSGWNARTRVLHCPSEENVTALKDALQRGDIYLNGFPHDGEASYYPDASMFEAALALGANIAKSAGVRPPVAVSQRDVPGWTRATLPLLNKHGIIGLSFGSGTPPGKPDTPALFLWRDTASGSEVVATWETGYGNDHVVFVLPNGVAMAVCWEGDNMGPPDLTFVNSTIDYLEQNFRGATVKASTMDAFFTEANKAENKARLPVITQDIGDGWIYGVPSDPLKNAQFRAAARIRRACLDEGSCDSASAAIKALDTLLVKIPEHTWGVAQGWFLPDYENYTNVKFDAARAQRGMGFVKDNTHHADYYSTINSWVEQRTFVTNTPDVLVDEYPELSARMRETLHNISHPEMPSTEGFTHVPSAEVPEKRFACGDLTVGFGSSGALVQLDDARSGVSWATNQKRIGEFRYQSFTDADYRVFLKDFASRTGSGCANYNPATTGCGNFFKPNVTLGHPVRRDLTGTLTELWTRTTADSGTCDFIVNVSLPQEAVQLAGAPEFVVISVGITNAKTISFDVLQVNKRPTRLPEAIFFSFDPAVDVVSAVNRAPDRVVPPEVSSLNWTLTVLGSEMLPTDVFASAGVYGGSPHMRGVESVQWAGKAGGFVISSLDVPILVTGNATPFISPRTEAPNMSLGVHYNIYQNIWNTNYILWYPFNDEDKNIRSRFTFALD
eukprot:m.1154078 g.1154078  ORF g.1154078 m.1154078 type:complete len:814 (-) comp24488_c0_seq7:2031-4472(-)